MEGQRSFSFRPIRLLLFFVTLSSSLLLCLFLSGYFSLQEKAHIRLGSIFDTPPGESFQDFSGEHHNSTALDGGEDVEKPHLGSTPTHQKGFNLTPGTQTRGPLLPPEDPDSLLETKEAISKESHFGTGLDSSSKGDSFPEDPSGDMVNKRSCDIYKGRWVFDESYPSYTNETCPFIDVGFSCQSNGRPDKDYMKWKWQPSDCNLPRFDAARMLEVIRGKRLVFAGDSIGRNQWESLLCMLRQGISRPNRMYEARGRRVTKRKGVYSFRFPDYECSVEFYVSHFLAREGVARIRKRRVSTLRIDSMDRRSSRWKGADILVFNTAHWWSHHKTKAGRNYFQEGKLLHPHLNATKAFRKALLSWASWIDRHVDPSKTMVFFRSSSPSHYSGGEWNSGGHCRERTHPLEETTARRSPELNAIVEQVVRKMKTPVTLLNVTAMAGLRIDGHPSIYGRNPGDRSSSRRRIQDCSHWCLPGVPDVWNELLYYNLLLSRKNITK